MVIGYCWCLSEVVVSWFLYKIVNRRVEVEKVKKTVFFFALFPMKKDDTHGKTKGTPVVVRQPMNQ